jgi:3-deoxy-D-manno-octulosonate 8-phosphate phosphatase (KDO 8-P phosphatase)
MAVNAPRISAGDLDAIVFDFDGVLTDNFVYVDQNGRESVRCCRADGLAFDALRRTPLKLFILSTERNPVVLARGRKLKVRVFQGQADKSVSLQGLARRQRFSLARTLFVGNDVNDLGAMRLCGRSACPADSHPAVRRAATFVLATAGGYGVARELVETVMGLDVTPPPARRVREAG